MTNDLYAPPRAAVADVIPGPLMDRPWQVTLAVRLCWLSLLLSLPIVIDTLFFDVPDDVERSIYTGVMLAILLPLLALTIVLYLMMARGYRWARIAYSVLTLLGFLGMVKELPEVFARAWYLGVLDIVVNALGAATLWLLFTGPANAWFRTRGGRFAPP